MSLYNEIKKGFRIENAYDRWENYRNTLTDYLIDLADYEEIQIDRIGHFQFSDSMPTLGIVGAGACNDLDLKRLISVFSKIVLIDTDEEALEEGISREQLSDDDRIQKKIYSLNGMKQSQYEAFTLALQEFVTSHYYDLTPELFCEYAMDYVKSIYDTTFRINKADFGTYDYVWCFGVYSQLQSMFGYIYRSFLIQLEKRLFPEADMVTEPFYDLLRRMNEKQIPAINDVLIESSNRYTVFGNEWDMIEDANKVYKWTEVPKHGIEGAYQAITDVKKRQMKCREKLLLWPFCQEQNQNFMVLIQEIKK